MKCSFSQWRLVYCPLGPGAGSRGSISLRVATDLLFRRQLSGSHDSLEGSVLSGFVVTFLL